MRLVLLCELSGPLKEGFHLLIDCCLTSNQDILCISGKERWISNRTHPVQYKTDSPMRYFITLALKCNIPQVVCTRTHDPDAEANQLISGLLHACSNCFF